MWARLKTSVAVDGERGESRGVELGPGSSSWWWTGGWVESGESECGVLLLLGGGLVADESLSEVSPVPLEKVGRGADVGIRRESMIKDGRCLVMSIGGDCTTA